MTGTVSCCNLKLVDLVSCSTNDRAVTWEHNLHIVSLSILWLMGMHILATMAVYQMGICAELLPVQSRPVCMCARALRSEVGVRASIVRSHSMHAVGCDG